MSARRLILLAALALASACSQTSTRPGLRLNGPSGVAVFQGKTATDPNAVRAYLAVANARGDDLRILDAIDGKAVLAPALIESLAVPTAPRPSFLAAGSLSDEGGPGADLLAVAPAGLATCDPDFPLRLVSCVQIVRTWSEIAGVADTAVVRERALSLVIDTLPGGVNAPVVSLAVVPVPVPDGNGGFTAAHGQARLVAGLAGGHLLVADFGRIAGGEGIERLGAAVHDLGFEATSLSASPTPSEANLVYAASPDLPGVAELDLAPAVDQVPGFRVFPAGAPTTHVLAARVRPFVRLGSDSTKDDDFDAAGVTRIYAALDPAACGRDRPITCGLAVLDPATGAPLADPAGELSQYLPIDVLGNVVAMVAVHPPAVGGLADGTVAPDGVPGVLQALSTLGGTRHVSTLAAVALEGGSVVLVDLARGALALDHPSLAVSSGLHLQVRTVASTVPSATHRRLGLWGTVDGTGGVLVDPTEMAKLVRVTAGYTETEAWKIEWQGLLPGLAGLRGQLDPAEGWVAIQAGSGATPATPPYRGVGRLYDPALGVHVGDLVVFSPDDTVRCPNGAFELEVTGILAPDADHPGGAVQVLPRPLDQQPTTTVGTTVVSGNPACLDGAGRSAGVVSLRSGGLLLTGTAFGYAGRPEVSDTIDGPLVSVAWSAADAALACPLLDAPAWPLGADGTWPAAALCDDACRRDCEALLRARRARRAAYVKEQCPGTDTACRERNGGLPLLDPTGPVVEFRLGWVPTSTNPTETARGTLLSFGTVAGRVPVVRRPASGTLEQAAILPTGLATFDRAQATLKAADGVRVFASYTGNEVLDFSPSLPQASVTVLK